jgi:hypothetical protein
MRAIATILITSIIGCFGASIGFVRPQVKYGLVGHWTMNEGTGTNVFDASGLRNSGIFSNTPIWTNGIVLSALKFDAALQQSIEIPDNVSLCPSNGTWSIATWLRTGQSNSAIALIWKYGISGNNMYCIGVASDNKIFGYYRDAGANTVQAGSTTAGVGGFIPNNNWWHIAWIRRTQTIGDMYTNGVLVTSITNSAITNINTLGGPNLQLGRYTFGLWTSGNLDDVRIYNRALSTDEIKQLYGGGYGSH